jgi:RNA 3'-terminal phosphate cyclase
MVATPLLKFQGHLYFRQRIILSLLSGKAIRIDEIRSHSEEPGVTGKGLQSPNGFSIHLFVSVPK